MVNKSSFYMVVGTSGIPYKQHVTIHDALNEARRLACLNPGLNFWVLKSVREIKAVQQPVFEETQMDGPSNVKYNNPRLEYRADGDKGWRWVEVPRE